MLELYQFPFSHFCEKARWALDYKRVSYRVVNLLPGLHAHAVKKVAPQSCVPVLVVDRGTAIQESSAIINYLDRSHPDPALTPADAAQAREALAWEEYLDEHVGVALRLCYYYHALPDRALTLRFMLDGAPWYARPLLTLGYSQVRAEMQRRMNINDDTNRQSQAQLLAAFDKLDETLQERRFLVGDRFSRADLTACALLSPLCLPDDRQASDRFPQPLLAVREHVKGRLFYRWVRNVYDNYRQPMLVDAGRPLDSLAPG